MKYIYTALLLLGTFIVSAQTIYRKASVTTNNDQTLTGYISIHNWDKNPKYIEFKSNPGDTDVKKFYPADVKSFVINGYQQYLTYRGSVSVNHISMLNLPKGKDTTSVIDAIFLRQIATGDNVTLYSYTDKIKTRFFIKEKQNLPYELLYQEYYDKLHNIHTVKQYTGQVNVLILRYTDSTENLKKMDTIRYHTNDMLDVVTVINGNKNPVVPKSHSRLYAGAALTINNLSYFPARGSNHDANYGKEVAYGPKITAGIDFMNNTDIQGFILRFELSADQFNTQFTSLDKSNLKQYGFTQKNLAITTQGIWNIYNSDPFKLYIGAGISLAIENSYGNDYVLPRIGLSSFTYNVPAQAGIVLNRKIELYFSGTVREPSYAGPGETLRSNTYNLGLHYLFGHR